jgi:hypothetical protein
MQQGKSMDCQRKKLTKDELDQRVFEVFDHTPIVYLICTTISMNHNPAQ